MVLKKKMLKLFIIGQWTIWRVLCHFSHIIIKPIFKWFSRLLFKRRTSWIIQILSYRIIQEVTIWNLVEIFPMFRVKSCLIYLRCIVLILIHRDWSLREGSKVVGRWVMGNEANKCWILDVGCWIVRSDDSVHSNF